MREHPFSIRAIAGHPEPRTAPSEQPAANTALTDLVRSLARQAAREAFAVKARTTAAEGESDGPARF